MSNSISNQLSNATVSVIAQLLAATSPSPGHVHLPNHTHTPADLPTASPGPTDHLRHSSARALEDLLTLIGSAVSIISIIFTLVLYLHYRHLHSQPNHMFMTILLVDLVAACTYFGCIFFVTDEQRHSKEHCNACGFVEQFYSMSEPCLVTLFWANIYLLCNGYGSLLTPRCCGQRRTVQPAMIVGVLVVSLGTSIGALVSDMYSADGQAWCWIGSEYTWYRIVFCWMWTLMGLLVMVTALIKPLMSSFLNEMQKKLLLRRGMMVLAWFIINAVNFISRFFADDTWLRFQALVNPLTGCLNVLAFLYSERMMTIRALGLPPGAEPTYGFTAAMKYIPDKLREAEQLL